EAMPPLDTVIEPATRSVARARPPEETISLPPETLTPIVGMPATAYSTPPNWTTAEPALDGSRDGSTTVPVSVPLMNTEPPLLTMVPLPAPPWTSVAPLRTWVPPVAPLPPTPRKLALSTVLLAVPPNCTDMLPPLRT